MHYKVNPITEPVRLQSLLCQRFAFFQKFQNKTSVNFVKLSSQWKHFFPADIRGDLLRCASIQHLKVMSCFQDLVGKLKDAAKSAEKASQMWCWCPVSSAAAALFISSQPLLYLTSVWDMFYLCFCLKINKHYPRCSLSVCLYINSLVSYFNFDSVWCCRSNMEPSSWYVFCQHAPVSIGFLP